jgi:Ca2+-binding EF-hand superfamily protein
LISSKFFYHSFLVFEESFSLLDKDGDGNISNYEIRSLMNSLGYSPSEEDIASVIAKIDTDGHYSPSKQNSLHPFSFLR